LVNGAGIAILARNRRVEALAIHAGINGAVVKIIAIDRSVCAAAGATLVSSAEVSVITYYWRMLALPV